MAAPLWLNPPYSGDGLARKFVTKALEHYGTGDVQQAILLLSVNFVDTGWFQPLWDFPLCFTRKKIDFRAPNGDVTSN